jgi:N-acetyl-anhydromuramyl-L-alanine amidase AmpD
MRYDTLAADEAAFKNRTDYTFTPFTVPVAGENLSLNGVFCKPKNRSGYFNTPEPPHGKQRIVLHFTAGNLSGGVNTLTTQNFRVSVPFVIARDGTVYQLFPSKDWSGHIGAGIGNAGTGNAQDKVTIAIEIINYGYLVERGANLETIYSRPKENPGRIDLYCPLTQTGAYQKLNVPFRDQKYYASYAQKQYESLIILLRFLTKKYNIPRQFLDEPARYQGTQDVLSFKGIVSHVNYRTGGKWDLGPAFDWQQVVAGVQAQAYQPASATREAFVAEEEGVITDESSLEAQWTEPRGVEVAPPEDFESHFNDDEGSAVKPDLYALVVGIDAYEDQVVLNRKVAFPKLRGCVADATKVRSYLENDGSFDQRHIQFLTNQQATKAGIVKAFQELGQAGKEDVIVFYYSGHGTQELADAAVWTSEQDGKLECLVSYYDEDHADDYLISDKELRYLIREVSKNGAHITVISDCCHSGDNTRNAGLIKSTYEEVIERRIPYVFPQRTWDKFIFGETLSADDFAGKHIDAILPPARHVSLSACESDESAVEVSGEGVFTKYLLKSLEASGGQISYAALHGRVKQMLNNAFEQTPVMYIPAAFHQELALNNVFNKPGGAGNTTYADVIRDGAGNWVLQRGAVHGIGRATGGITVRDDDKLFEAKVRSVGADTTILAFDNAVESELDTTKVYKGFVEGLMSQQLKIHLNSVDNILTDSLLLAEKLMSEIPAQARLEAKEAEADYTLSFRNGRAVLTKPFDTFRPVVEQIELDSEAFASELVKDLKHISNWHFLKNLRNDAAAGTPLRVEVSDADGNPIDTGNDVARLHYQQVDGEWKGSIKIKITNTGSRKLYCCCVFLDASFGASLALLDPIVTPLDPGASKELSFDGQTTIPISLDNYVQLYNWPKNAEYLQFIASAEDLSNIEELALESLPAPFTVRKKGSTRGIGASAGETDKSVAASWSTHLLTLEFVNPEYNIVAESDLATMLEDENLAEYALGNYFEVKTKPDLQPEYQLKPDVQLRKSDAHLDEKGFIRDGLLDVANKTARLIRNSKYRIMRLRFPNAPKIVSEGDSWFQHPLVVDTIDHLSKVYPIFCVAAAGDTLANYDREGEWLEAVEDKSPRFFLVSGGGNDVLGEQFRNHIKAGPHETGLKPQDYLESSLTAELDNLQVIYRRMFNELFALRPDIHALCHGYDYITPLEKTDKGWLGRYMIEKGMTSQTDRKGVISYILNEFNDRLRTVAAEFPHVHYINARGLVADDQWYDEIHPNKLGFQAVAGSFLNVIDGLSDN